MYWDGFTNPITAANGSELPLIYQERYKGSVSLTQSAINLPVNVFENWTDVKNTIQWTRGLNRAFEDNYLHNSDNIYWQYIGTPQGALRSYPATYIGEKYAALFEG